jgi:hypothetical protein
MTSPAIPEDAWPQQRGRPRSVVFAATLQLLAVVPFLIGSIVVLIYGADAQAAAETEVARQGIPTATLADHGVSFGSNSAELPLPIAIVVILATLAVLNLAGNRIGRILSWIFHPILFVAGCIIIPGQLFTTQYLEAAFKKSGDPMLERINVQAMVDAATHVFPGWLPYVNVGKLVLTTLGSLLVIILLAAPSARAFFRKARPATEQAQRLDSRRAQVCRSRWARRPGMPTAAPTARTTFKDTA